MEYDHPDRPGDRLARPLRMRGNRGAQPGKVFRPQFPALDSFALGHVAAGCVAPAE